MKKLIFILILTVIAGSAFCKTITVTSSADSGVGTLRQAVLDASANDTIVFEDSITTILLTSHIKIDKSITIIGDSINTTILSAPSSRHFSLSNIDDYVIASLKNLTLKDGYFYTCGGSIYNLQGNTLYLDKCVFDNNKSGSTCGAIYNYGTLKINHCLFTNNTCTSDAGVIYSRGQLYIYNSIFTRNQGLSSGCLENSNFAHLVCNLFVGNISTNTNGAAIYNYNTGSIESSIAIINTTIADNIGSGLYAENGVKLYNSIVINNNSDNDVLVDTSSEIVSANNLIGTSNIDLSGNGNIFSPDPLFVDSGNNNYSLQANSPAIDSGDISYLPDSILIDLIGNHRVSDSTIDIGAYEYQTTSSVSHISKSSLNIYSIGHRIYVDNTSSLLVAIYDMMGYLIAQGNKSVFSISHTGIYLVCVNNVVQKVIVK